MTCSSKVLSFRDYNCLKSCCAWQDDDLLLHRSSYTTAGAGNVLWDCINVLTPDTIEEVQSKGGVQAIAISHPHFYTGMAAWAEAFDAPVFIHAKDRQWVTEPCSRITFWEGGHPPTTV